MATKDDGLLFLKGKQKTFINSSLGNDNQYSNLNLNHQNHKCLSVTSVPSKSNSNDNKRNNFATKHCLTHEKPKIFFEKLQPYQKNESDNINSNNAQNGINSLNKSINDFSKKHGIYNSDKEKQQKNKIRSNVINSSNSNKSSTLSLHIAAYENSIEACNQNLDTVSLKQKQNKSCKNWKNVKQLLTEPKSKIQDPFEFPRHKPDDQIMDPEVMQFKASQKLLNSNDLNFNVQNLMSMNFSKDEVFDSMVDVIYMLTAQPIIYKKLLSYYAFCGQPYELEETCQELGYKSFNHCIRENQQVFGRFLDIFVSKNAKNEFVLYYQNRDIKNKGIVLENLQDKSIEDGHVQISIVETLYFEIHNELQYLEGRKKFAELVNYCEVNDKVNQNRYVQMEHIQIAFRELYDEEYSNNTLKKLFPNQGGRMEQILQNILFEEIEYLPPNTDQKQGLQFRIKAGLTMQKIDDKLDGLKRRIKPFLANLEQHIAISRQKRNNDGPSYRPQRQHPYQQQQPSSSTTPANRFIGSGGGNNIVKNEPSPFGLSDSEEDERAENRQHCSFSRKHSTKNDGIAGEQVMMDTLKREPPKPAAPKIRTIADFAQKYEVTEDEISVFYVEELEEVPKPQKVVKVEEKVESIKAATANVAEVKIAVNPSVATEIVPAAGLRSHFLNPSAQNYDDDESYTDGEEMEKEEEKNGNSSGSSSSKNDTTAIASKPLPSPLAATATKANQQKSGQSGSSRSDEDDDDYSENSFNNFVNMPCPNNSKSPNENKFHGQDSDGDNSDKQCSKTVKEEHRKEREKSNGTHLKKEQQNTHHLPTPARNPAAAAPVLNDLNRATPAAPPYVPSETRQSARTVQPEAISRATAASRTPPSNNSHPEPSNIRRDSTRHPIPSGGSTAPRDPNHLPHNYGSSNNDASGRRSKEEPKGPKRVESPVFVPVAQSNTIPGGFKVPYNIAKSATNDTPPPTATAASSATSAARSSNESRKNPDRANQRIVQPYPRRLPSHPASPSPPPRSNNRTTSATGVAHGHVETHFRAEPGHPEIDNCRPPSDLERNRQMSQSSMDSQSINVPPRRRQAHNYSGRPASALPQNDYGGNNHHRQPQEHDPTLSDGGFYQRQHPRRAIPESDNVLNETYVQQQQYYDHHQQEQRHHQRQQQQPDDYQRGNPQRTRNDYQPPQQQQHHPHPQDYPHPYDSLPPQDYPEFGDRRLPQEPRPQSHLRHYPQNPPPPPPPPPQQRYYDGGSHYATPLRTNGFQSISTSEQQHYLIPNHPQQGNYYAHSDNSRDQFDNRSTAGSYQQQQHHRPASALPQSNYHANSIPRPGSSISGRGYGNSAEFRSTSVVPEGFRLREAAVVENEVNSVIQQIRASMAGSDGFMETLRISVILRNSFLPDHPENMGINMETWEQFINAYLSDQFRYCERQGVKYIVDPNRVDIDDGT